jgi:predicted amidophosphoribosyltransferase
MVAAGLTAACLPVGRPGPGTCPVCRAGVDRAFRRCRNCDDHARRLDAPLDPVTPITLATPDSPLYLALKRYKSGRRHAAGQALRLATLAATFFDRHLACVAPGGIDAVVVVPSLTGRRGPHPLLGVLRLVRALPAADDWLSPGPRGVERGHAARDLVACRGDVDGRRVLLFDDTYTTGARVQSAAWALRAAGAAAVHPVVVARYVRDDWLPSRALLHAARARPWDPDRCVHCDR